MLIATQPNDLLREALTPWREEVPPETLYGLFEAEDGSLVFDERAEELFGELLRNGERVHRIDMTPNQLSRLTPLA